MRFLHCERLRDLLKEWHVGTLLYGLCNSLEHRGQTTSPRGKVPGFICVYLGLGLRPASTLDCLFPELIVLRKSPVFVSVRPEELLHAAVVTLQGVVEWLLLAIRGKVSHGSLLASFALSPIQEGRHVANRCHFWSGQTNYRRCLFDAQP